MAVTWTNKHNLPEVFVNAITNDNHVVNGDISVTQLIDAPQIRQLKRLTNYELDVTDMIGMMLGTAMHEHLERLSFSSNYRARILKEASGILRSNQPKVSDWLDKYIEESFETDKRHTLEMNLTMEINGWTLSGTFDIYDKLKKELDDWKVTSASMVMFPEFIQSRKTQLNIYKVMAEHNGLEVDSAKIRSVIKDWSKMKILSNKDYPKIPYDELDVPLLEEEVVMKYLRKRVDLHQRAENGESIPCTPKDRWAKADTYAVKKKGLKKAKRVFDNKAMAEKFMNENNFKFDKELYVEFRPSESFRCKNGYCPVSEVCPQYQKEKELSAEKAQDM